jgi:hypothetical protein
MGCSAEIGDRAVRFRKRNDDGESKALNGVAAALARVVR